MSFALALALATAPLHTHEQAELRHRDALGQLQEKGLLMSDLPPEVASLDAAAAAALRAGEWDRAFALADELGRAVARLELDQRFLDAKLRRLGAQLGRKPLDGAAAEQLLREATSLAADGQYGSANARLNRLAAMLQ